MEAAELNEALKALDGTLKIVNGPPKTRSPSPPPSEPAPNTNAASKKLRTGKEASTDDKGAARKASSSPSTHPQRRPPHLRTQYEGANWAQGDAQTQAVALLALLKKEVAEVLTPLHRDLQGTADQVYTHRDPINAAQRTAFGLQPDRPLVD